MKWQWLWNLFFAGALFYLAWNQIRIDALLREQITACVRTIGNQAELSLKQNDAIRVLQGLEPLNLKIPK